MMVRNSLISTFYTAFQQKDAAGMKACYSPKVIFNDPVFRNLDYDGVTAMWEMLLKNGKDLVLEFEVLEENEQAAKANYLLGNFFPGFRYNYPTKYENIG